MSKSSETDLTPLSAEMSCFNEICEFLERPATHRVGGYILATSKTRPTFYFAFRTFVSESILLFSSVLAAKEAAYMLRSNWDGVNAVTVDELDSIAVHNVLELLLLELGADVDCCQSGEYCYLPNKEQINESASLGNNKEILFEELLMQGLKSLPPITFE